MERSNQEKYSRGHRRRIIGLTGGIGMGKTAVSDYLASVHDLPILDADLYARDAVKTDSPILSEIVERYGTGMLLPDGSLDRRRLGNLVFKNPSERLWLEQRIHPYVREQFVNVLAEDFSLAPIVLVVPLLFEARMIDLVSEIWVVYCSREKQVERLVQRDIRYSPEGQRLSLEEIQARIDSQMSIAKKLAAADVRLDNSFSLEILHQQVDLALAQPHASKIPSFIPQERV